MIKVETVLTATPIALERISPEFDLAEKTGPLIQGLNQSVVTLDGYDIKNVATELPKVTEGDSEHTVLVEQSSELIANSIRSSLSSINEYIIPACDILENNLKNCHKKEKAIDYIFDQFHLTPVFVDGALLVSPVLQVEPDQDYLNGLAFDVQNLNMGSWPTLGAKEIANLCKETLEYPEMLEVFGNEENVVSAYNAISTKPYWLYNDGSNVTVNQVKLNFDSFNKVIILNALLYKLDSQDEPLDGVEGISLEEYRTNIRRLKRFTKTLLFRMKKYVSAILTNGIDIIIDRPCVIKKTDDEYSPLYGIESLSGGVTVLYNQAMADYFENSDKASMSEVVLGMVLANVSNINVKGDGVVDRIPGYMEIADKYITLVQQNLVGNIKKLATSIVNESLSEIANKNNWKEFLTNSTGPGNLVVKLQNKLNEQGGYLELLTSPAFISDLIDEKTRVASSIVAVRLADVIGSPIASKILKENMDADCSCLEKQRKALSKAIVRVVIETLMK